MPLDPNDSAFPVPNVAVDFDPGLTKREYIAVQVLSAFLSSSGFLGYGKDHLAQIKGAVEIADLLIKELP